MSILDTEIAMIKAEKEYPESLSRYSTFWARFWAISFDSTAIIPFYYLGLALAILLAKDEGKKYYSLFGPCLVYIYYIAMHGICGKTFGKMLFNIKLFSNNGQKVRWSQSIIRESIPLALTIAACVFFSNGKGATSHENPVKLTFENTDDKGQLFFISIYILWEIIVFISMLLNDKRRSIQDKLAGTVVIKSDNVRITRVIFAFAMGYFQNLVGKML
jgi:uncharacterized RDD family membrane protein YckC